MEVNPEVVINDLLDQIRRLTLENSLLRSAISEYQQVPAVEDTDED
jgi:hypothetical protein